MANSSFRFVRFRERAVMTWFQKMTETFQLLLVVLALAAADNDAQLSFLSRNNNNGKLLLQYNPSDQDMSGSVQRLPELNSFHEVYSWKGRDGDIQRIHYAVDDKGVRSNFHSNSIQEPQQLPPTLSQTPFSWPVYSITGKGYPSSNPIPLSYVPEISYGTKLSSSVPQNYLPKQTYSATKYLSLENMVKGDIPELPLPAVHRSQEIPTPSVGNIQAAILHDYSFAAKNDEKVLSQNQENKINEKGKNIISYSGKLNSNYVVPFPMSKVVNISNNKERFYYYTSNLDIPHKKQFSGKNKYFSTGTALLKLLKEAGISYKNEDFEFSNESNASDIKKDLLAVPIGSVKFAKNGERDTSIYEIAKQKKPSTMNVSIPLLLNKALKQMLKDELQNNSNKNINELILISKQDNTQNAIDRNLNTTLSSISDISRKTMQKTNAAFLLNELTNNFRKQANFTDMSKTMKTKNMGVNQSFKDLPNLLQNSLQVSEDTFTTFSPLDINETAKLAEVTFTPFVNESIIELNESTSEFPISTTLNPSNIEFHDMSPSAAQTEAPVTINSTLFETMTTAPDISIIKTQKVETTQDILPETIISNENDSQFNTDLTVATQSEASTSSSPTTIPEMIKAADVNVTNKHRITTTNLTILDPTRDTYVVSEMLKTNLAPFTNYGNDSGTEEINTVDSVFSSNSSINNDKNNVLLGRTRSVNETENNIDPVIRSKDENQASGGHITYNNPILVIEVSNMDNLISQIDNFPENIAALIKTRIMDVSQNKEEHIKENIKSNVQILPEFYTKSDFRGLERGANIFESPSFEHASKTDEVNNVFPKSENRLNANSLKNEYTLMHPTFLENNKRNLLVENVVQNTLQAPITETSNSYKLNLPSSYENIPRSIGRADPDAYFKNIQYTLIQPQFAVNVDENSLRLPSFYESGQILNTNINKGIYLLDNENFRLDGQNVGNVPLTQPDVELNNLVPTIEKLPNKNLLSEKNTMPKETRLTETSSSNNFKINQTTPDSENIKGNLLLEFLNLNSSNYKNPKFSDIEIFEYMPVDSLQIYQPQDSRNQYLQEYVPFIETYSKDQINTPVKNIVTQEENSDAIGYVPSLFKIDGIPLQPVDNANLEESGIN